MPHFANMFSPVFSLFFLNTQIAHCICSKDLQQCPSLTVDVIRAALITACYIWTRCLVHKCFDLSIFLINGILSAFGFARSSDHDELLLCIW